MLRAVIDTNILVSGLQSSLGASNEVLRWMALRRFQVGVSAALLFEYEDVLHRPGLIGSFSALQIDGFLDSFCSVAVEAHIYFRWRPLLPDANDDLVFECALAFGATHIITHNRDDFEPAAAFNISVVTPGRFLHILQRT